MPLGFCLGGWDRVSLFLLQADRGHAVGIRTSRFLVNFLRKLQEKKRES